MRNKPKKERISNGTDAIRVSVKQFIYLGDPIENKEMCMK